MKSYLPEMTYVEVLEAIDDGAVALLPIGTVEGNAPHLPMGYDYLFAEAVAQLVAERTRSVRLPGIAYGVSELLSGFPGTVFIQPETLQVQVDSILRSLIKHGFEHIVLLSNHIPNQYPIELACRRVRADTGVLVASVYPGLLAKDLGDDIFGATAEVGHGGEPGTSIMMHISPNGVRMDLVEDAGKTGQFAGFDMFSPFAVAHNGSQVNLYLNLHELTSNGSMARPETASAEKGAAIVDRIVDFVTSFVDRFRDTDTRTVSNVVDHYPLAVERL
jgi:creatinine amidohydrolase